MGDAGMVEIECFPVSGNGANNVGDLSETSRFCNAAEKCGIIYDLTTNNRSADLKTYMPAVNYNLRQERKHGAHLSLEVRCRLRVALEVVWSCADFSSSDRDGIHA